jgi:hypothetical protein
LSDSTIQKVAAKKVSDKKLEKHKVQRKEARKFQTQSHIDNLGVL